MNERHDSNQNNEHAEINRKTDQQARNVQCNFTETGVDSQSRENPIAEHSQSYGGNGAHQHSHAQAESAEQVTRHRLVDGNRGTHQPKHRTNRHAQRPHNRQSGPHQADEGNDRRD